MLFYLGIIAGTLFINASANYREHSAIVSGSLFGIGISFCIHAFVSLYGFK